MAKKHKQKENAEENQGFDSREIKNLNGSLLSTENQSHNAKKEALGPNTKR